MTDDSQLGPDVFFEEDSPNPVFDVNQTLRRSEGGLIEAVKRAVVTAMRDALSASTLRLDGKEVYVDLEYPAEETQYPGIWVQFSPTKLARAGVSHEFPILEDGNWCLIQEWQFNGRVTLSITALKSLDRDRLADLVVNTLAFARTPDLVITKHDQDTKQYRALITALDSNPYVAMSLNTDQIYPGGQNISVGVPWTPENVLAYEDSYAFDVTGYFNVKFSHEGTYQLARIDVRPERVDHIEPRKSHRQDFQPDGGWRYI